MTIKYKCYVLLPLTVKNQKINPVSYYLGEFPNDPNLTRGERRILTYQDSDTSIHFDAIFVNFTENLRGDIREFTYVFEVADRNLALEIAQLVKQNNPNSFEEDNLIN